MRRVACVEWLRSSTASLHGGRLAKEFRSISLTAATNNRRRESDVGNPFPPWSPDPQAIFNTDLPVQTSDDQELNQAASLAALQKLPEAAIEIWTDGSVKASRDTRHKDVPGVDFWGGSGAVIRFRSPLLAHYVQMNWPTSTGSSVPTWASNTLTLKSAAGSFPSSYRTEQLALLNVLAGLEHATRGAVPVPLTVRVVTDSQSLLAALASGSHMQNDATNVAIWKGIRLLGARGWRFHLQFVFSHCGIEMNDAADAAAGNACNSEIASHDAVPLSRKCALARLRRVLWSNWSASAVSTNSQYVQWLDGRRAPPPRWLVTQGGNRNKEAEDWPPRPPSHLHLEECVAGSNT